MRLSSLLSSLVFFFSFLFAYFLLYPPDFPSCERRTEIEKTTSRVITWSDVQWHANGAAERGDLDKVMMCCALDHNLDIPAIILYAVRGGQKEVVRYMSSLTSWRDVLAIRTAFRFGTFSTTEEYDILRDLGYPVNSSLSLILSIKAKSLVGVNAFITSGATLPQCEYVAVSGLLRETFGGDWKHLLRKE